DQSRARLETDVVVEGRPAANDRMVLAKSRALVASALHAPDLDHDRVRQDRVSLEHQSVPVDTIRGVTVEHRRSGARPLTPILHAATAAQRAIAQHHASLDTAAERIAAMARLARRRPGGVPAVVVRSARSPIVVAAARAAKTQ